MFFDSIDLPKMTNINFVQSLSNFAQFSKIKKNKNWPKFELNK